MHAAFHAIRLADADADLGGISPRLPSTDEGASALSTYGSETSGYRHVPGTLKRDPRGPHVSTVGRGTAVVQVGSVPRCLLVFSRGSKAK